MKRTADPLIVLLTAGIVLGARPAMADESHTHSHHDDDHAHHEDDNHHRDGDHADHDDEEATGETRQAGAHSHGDASLAVAIDGARVFFELDSPMYNLLGFEHAPKTPGEVDKHRKVAATLSQPDRLFSVNADAKCEADGSHSVDLFEPAEHDDDHADDHSESDSDHRDVLVEYEFTCKAPERIGEIVVHLFDLFPELTQLDTVFLGADAQRALRLTKDNHRITTNR